MILQGKFILIRMDSFLHITNWLNIVKGLAHQNACIVLVGNKKDLKDDRVVSVNEASKFCQENDILYLECSALVGEGVEDIFKTASKNIVNKIENGTIIIDDGKNVNKVIPKKKEEENTSYTRCSYC